MLRLRRELRTTRISAPPEISVPGMRISEVDLEAWRARRGG